ncbi:Pentatricopeptide repeat-containing protein [Actinidia chinensis var. chinensis]|uniref:Pentatricopeptide repeat-containing protein n=1 Tax=Actinidia chinensis var. chinensis TaxID=1590841 RepID=A0A2R6RSS5_ACTCC|nr:Pentatricopeptide repeat-containing protein [Actinidia chinensis var. chinensis]
MLSLRYCPAIFARSLESFEFPGKTTSAVVCAAKGPRPRYPRVWKTTKKIGTISKSVKLVECVKGLSNVKEEVYGALDSFIAWELEFPLITVKKALKTLEDQKEWKRIIQLTKWMLSKGQGRTNGSYYTLLNALAEDGRHDEAEELWMKLFSDNLESTPRMFFDKMISIYYHKGMHDKMFEIFADMEELGMRPTVSIVSMVGDVFQKLGMLDKYKKLKKKYPPPKWEYRYIKGKRVKIRAKSLDKSYYASSTGVNKFDKETDKNSGLDEDANKADLDEFQDEANLSEDSDASLDDLDEAVNSDEFQDKANLSNDSDASLDELDENVNSFSETKI